MAGVNKVILVGNLGKDPEIMTFDNGVKKASFPLATTESYKNREGQRVETTEWHNVVLWRGLAEIAERFLRKGNQVFIEGKIKTRSFEQDGIKKYVTEIFGDNMTMLGRRENEGQAPMQSSQSSPAPKAQEPEIEAPDDDLPF
ncbi:MAG TPA: single-stranded DNA-binding protein [Bacteroidales bacterium]|nr:single-stranded DNA-binding protein [Bacteroidales bacterium]